jgi:hypothetical protein
MLEKTESAMPPTDICCSSSRPARVNRMLAAQTPTNGDSLPWVAKATPIDESR